MENMDKRKIIKRVVLWFLKSEEGEQLSYEVGINGVTEIIGAYSHHNGTYFQIFKDGKLYAELYDFSQVTYEGGQA